jgi:DNA-binding response OmpR family regulator
MAGSGGAATVLVVDDEQEVADAYALRLRREYDVRTAYGGEEALDTVDDDVDVVLLDRRMPDISGDGVLNELRVQGYDCAVVMLTAVAPSLDVADMAFDDYLCKPVDEGDLFAAIENQVETAAVDHDALEQYAAVTSKLSLLEDQYAAAELEGAEEYETLKAEAERLREQLASEIPDLDARLEAIRGVDRGSG